MRWFGRRREESRADDSNWERVQAAVVAAKQHRYEQTALQRDLVQEVSAILFRADPIGINFETNTDEYDAEAETIVIALPRATGPDDLKAITHETFVQWFDAKTAGPVDQYAAVASDIWNLWRRHGGQSGLTGSSSTQLPS